MHTIVILLMAIYKQGKGI